MEKYNSRKEVPEKYRCDLNDFFNDSEDFNINYDKCLNMIKELERYKGCCSSADKLLEFLKKDVDTSSLLENLYVYAYLIDDLELGISENIERKNKAELLYMELGKTTSFFEPELLQLDKSQYEKLFVDNKGLLDYKTNLDKIYREKEHILTEEEEKIITMLASATSDDSISSNLLNNEHNYGTIKLDDGSVEVIATNNYRHLLKNKNRDIRKKVYTKLNKVLAQYSSTNAALLNNYITLNVRTSEIRKYKSSWDKKLFHLNLSDKVFNTLVSTTEKNLSVFQKYYHLRKEVLGLDTLNPYDLSVNLNNNTKNYTIEEAKEITLKALEPLGDEYLSKFKKIFDNRYIDFCQYKGKCSGAYSISTSTNNSRILMSYNNNLESISTIIHEGGHNVHHQYILENNLPHNRDTYAITAEVASLTNECLLSNYFVKYGKTKEEKLAGIENILDVIDSNLFGAVREGKMEQSMYEYVENGNSITKDYMDNLSYKSLKKYYGKEVKLNKYSKNDWVRRSHYYMNFYLYSYAICISVASSVASKIIEGDQDMLNRYLSFLKVGSDKWPEDIFKVLGVDLEDSQVYEDAIKYFSNLIDQYESIYNETEVK